MQQHHKDVPFGLGQNAGKGEVLDDRTCEGVPSRSSDAQRFIDSVNEGFEVSHDPSSLSPDSSTPDTCESHEHNSLSQEELENKTPGDVEVDVGESISRMCNGNADLSGMTDITCDQVERSKRTKSVCDKVLCELDDERNRQNATPCRTDENGAKGNAQKVTDELEQKGSSGAIMNSDRPDICEPCQRQKEAPSSESGQLTQHGGDISGTSSVLTNGERCEVKEAPAVKFKVPPKKIFKPTLEVRKYAPDKKIMI